MNINIDVLICGLVRASLALAVSAVLVALCVRRFRVTAPRAEQWAWLFVLLQGLLIAPVLIPLPASWNVRPAITPVPTVPQAETVEARMMALPQSEAGHAEAAIASLPDSQGSAQPSVAAPSSDAPVRAGQLPRWSVIALALWAIGLVGIVGRGIYHYWQFVFRLRDVRAPLPSWNEEWRAVLRESGLSMPIELRVATDVGPVMCRLPRRSLVIVPESLWNELSAAERVAILRHEVEHVRRGDLWWSLLARLLAAVHWFNPCAWWAAANFEAQAEFVCDLAAGGDQRLRFADLLLRLGTGTGPQAAGIKAVASGRMYERIERLITGSEPPPRWRSALPLVIAVFLVCCAAVRFEARAPSVFADDKPTGAASTVSPPLQERALLRLGTAPFATRDFPTAIAFSPDGQRVAAAEANSPSHIIRIFDIATGLEVMKLADPESGHGWVNCMAFSPDGTRLVGGNHGGRLIVWDVAQRRVLFREMPLDDRVADVAFAPNGELIAISGSRGALQLRSAANPAEVVRELQSGPAKPAELGNTIERFSASGGIAFTANGGKLICANRATGSVLVWNLSTGTLLYGLNAVEGRRSPFGGASLTSVAITPDGKSIFTSGHRTVPRDTTTLAYGPKNVWIPQNRLWDIETGLMQRDLSDEHEYGLGTAVLLPDGERLAMQLYDEIVIRNLDDRKILQRVPLHGKFGHHLTLAPDGRYLAMQLGGRLAVFDVAAARQLHQDNEAGMDSVTSADWTRSGDRVVTAGADGNIRAWSAMTGKMLWSRPLAPYIKPTGRVSHPWFVDVDDNWQSVIAAGDRDDSQRYRCGTVTIFKAATGHVRGDVSLPKPIRAGAVAPKGRMAVFAGTNGSIGDTQLYGVDLDTLAVKFVSPPDGAKHGLWNVQAIEFLPDSSSFRIATGDSQIIEFDAESGEQLRIVSIDWRTPEQVVANKPKTAQLWKGCFTPDAAQLVSVAGENVYLWNAATGEQKLKFQHPHTNGCRLTISPDARMIVTSDLQYAGDYGTDTIRFFDTSGKELTTLDPGDARAHVLEFSPDGTKLFTGFFSRPPIIWEIH